MQKLLTLLKRYNGVKPIALVLLFCPIIYISITATLPFVSNALCNIAVISSSIAMLDTNFEKVQFDNEYNKETDDNADASGNIEYSVQEKPPELISATQQSNEQQNNSSDIKKPENAGVIKRISYSYNESNIFLPVSNNTLLKNCTTVSRDVIMKALKQKPIFKISADKTPEVLIMHTHATEAYQPFAVDWFDKTYNSRTTDNSKNTVRVGNEIQKQLEAAGIGVIHNDTQHDYPSYTGSYERSAITVKSILAKNPSIKVVLDVHRDAIQPDGNTFIAPTAQIDGKSAAQVMIISGCDNGKMKMPKYLENLKLSSILQKQIGENYPGLARPILFDYRKYNQDLTTGSILLEIGGHGNSLEEAIYTGELVGKSLAQALLSLK